MGFIGNYQRGLTYLNAAIKSSGAKPTGPGLHKAGVRTSPAMTDISWKEPTITKSATNLEVTGPAILRHLDQDGHQHLTLNSDSCKVIIKFESSLLAQEALDLISTVGEVTAHVILFSGVMEDFFITTTKGQTIRTESSYI